MIQVLKSDIRAHEIAAVIEVQGAGWLGLGPKAGQCVKAARRLGAP